VERDGRKRKLGEEGGERRMEGEREGTKFHIGTFFPLPALTMHCLDNVNAGYHNRVMCMSDILDC